MKGNEHVAAQNQKQNKPMEGKLVEKKRKEFTARLKTGRHVDDASSAIFGFAWLSRLQKLEPEQFLALVCLARGEPDAVGPAMMKTIKKLGVLALDGSLDIELKTLLLAALEETPKGLVLNDPWKNEDEEDKTVVNASKKELHRRLKEVLGDPDICERLR